MTAITHYEVYQASGGQWAMVSRFTGSEREFAMAEARRLEELNPPIAIIEENEELSSGQFEVRLIHRSAGAGNDIRVPAGGSDLGTRMFMIALNALTVGAVAAVIAAALLSRASFSGSVLNASLIAIFLGATLLSGLLVFRIYVPVGAILWRAKDSDSRRRTVLALAQGRVMGSADSTGEPDSYSPVSMPREAAAPSDAFQTSVAAPPTIEPPVLEPEPAPPPSAPAEATAEKTETPEASPAPAASEVAPAPPPEVQQISEQSLAALIEGLKPPLAKFTQQCLSTLAHTRPNLLPAERLALHLYLMGAARAAAERNGLDNQAARQLLEAMLEGARVPPHEAAAFFAELEINSERPSYRRMMDDGRAAMAAVAFGEVPVAPLPTITELQVRWSDPARGGEPQQVTFILTDMVGSTAMTSELGNAGAQRVVRAHNAVVRAAIKAFRGREVKHTGDGLLVAFPDSTNGARAAIDIQQEATTYAKDNPAAPLALRVGLHTGEAVLEDGDYYGPAVTIVSGLCALVNTGEICCSNSIRQRTPASFRYEEMGSVSVKGATTPLETLKLLWEQKRVAKKSVLEYRQIGTTTPPALAENGSQTGPK